MACVQVWDGTIDCLDSSKTLEEVTAMLEKLEFDPLLDKALELWHLHVQDSWPLTKQELQDMETKVNGTSTRTCRLSCVRAQSKHCSYAREQFVRAAADHVVPATRQWKVDLTNYDVEVVLLVQARSLAVGLDLRPYRQFAAKSFSQSGNILTGLVRLRPTTAQLLWGLLTLALGLGGDLILNNDSFRPLAADYSKRMKQQNVSCKADLLGWDAALLPLRNASVDAIVSDLPFGQQCLSSGKLEALLPLILGELGRAYPSILDSLTQLNSLQREGHM